MNADYITHYGDDLSACNAARVSMNKESDWEQEVINEGDGFRLVDKLSTKDEKLIHYLAKNKHFSCFEHQGVTLRLKVPLFVRSQIHRHRTFSYNEISRRYVRDELEFYWPDKWRKAAENVKQGSSDEAHGMVLYHGTGGKNDSTDLLDWMEDVHSDVVCLYNSMIEAGVCTEQARMILPQNLYTQFYMTGSLRNFCHFLKLRLDEHSQKECRDVAMLMADIIRPLFPVSFAALMDHEV